jgi:transposase
MPAPYSNDIRKSVINARKEGLCVKKIVSIFGVTKSAVYEWLKKYRETGDYKPLPKNCGRKPSLTSEELEEIRKEIRNKPDITLEELKEELGLPICISALCRIINNKLNFKYKKNFARKRAKQGRCKNKTRELEN